MSGALGSGSSTRPAQSRRLAGKYAPLVPVLAGLIARPDTPPVAPAKARILGHLRAAEKRFSALTGTR